MLFINHIHLIISVAFSSSVTPCLNAIFCPLIVVLLIAKHKIRPKRALSLLSLYTLLANVFCFHFSAWSWGFFLLNRILWILRLFFLFFNNSFCRFMDLSLETDALWMDEDAQSQFLWFFLRFLLIVCLAQPSWLLSSDLHPRIRGDNGAEPKC